jgi:hypothetical protein
MGLIYMVTDNWFGSLFGGLRANSTKEPLSEPI